MEKVPNVYEEFVMCYNEQGVEALTRARDLHALKLPDLEKELDALNAALKLMEKRDVHTNSNDNCVIRGLRTDKYYELKHVKEHVANLKKLIDTSEWSDGMFDRIWNWRC